MVRMVRKLRSPDEVQFADEDIESFRILRFTPKDYVEGWKQSEERDDLGYLYVSYSCTVHFHFLTHDFNPVEVQVQAVPSYSFNVPSFWKARVLFVAYYETFFEHSKLKSLCLS